MTHSFSSKNRNNIIQELPHSSFDLLIIGGGITGAGIALDAAARGLKVALVEMQDFASGTSGRSTKLIHGGLRYLKQLEFGLVAEVGRERKTIYHVAPHLTRPEPMLLPLRKGDALGKFSARMGMFVYEHLAGVLPGEKNKALNVSESLAQEPLLQKNKLTGGILFYEYRTDDARLTLEVLKQAVSLGALALNYVRVVSFNYEDGKLAGVGIKDQLTNTEGKIRAKYIVNASGPWTDDLASLDKKQPGVATGSKLKITKGVHVVLDHKRLPVKQSIYFEASDKRMLFVIPREGKTYVGTTDTLYQGVKLNPQITKEDRDYLLSCINTYFALSIRPSDIESGWAGLRPLINKPGKKVGEISRKDEIFISETGLVTIAGGKLTGYRKMAERVMKVIAARFMDDEKKILPPCTTDSIYLSGGKMDKPFPEFVPDKITDGTALGLSQSEAMDLVHRYGANVDVVYGIIRSIQSNECQGSANGLPEILYAQLLYAIEHELCISPADFMIRRTSLFYFNIQLVEKWRKAVMADIMHLLKLDAEVMKKFDDEMQGFLEDIRALRI